MANENLNPHDLMKRFSEKLKAAEKGLATAEKQAKKLADKHASVCAERESLTEQITEREEAVAPLLAEREQLRERYTVAAFEGKAGEQEDIHKRREEIDEKVEQHEQELSTLRTSLDDLGDMSREIAELVVKLESIAFGNAYQFGSELRTALIRYESTLNSRRDGARRLLPSVDLAVIEAVKEESDPEYLERKQRQADEVERARQDRARREQDRTDKASTPYVGWAGYVDQFGEKLPRGSVDADGSVKPQYQNKQGTRRAMPKNRTVEVVR